MLKKTLIANGVPIKIGVPQKVNAGFSIKRIGFLKPVTLEKAKPICAILNNRKVRIVIMELRHIIRNVKGKPPYGNTMKHFLRFKGF